MAEFLWEAALDALLDSLKMLPFLFLAYWLIEYIERRHSEKIEHALAGGGRFGFVPGALLGCVPQCGFSAMAANLYASKVITLGTLIAVFLSTSDEAVPLLIASPDHWTDLLIILGIKVLCGLIAGFVLDILLQKALPASLRGGYAGKQQEVDCHGHHEHDGILLASIKHTLSIFAFILVFNLLMGLLIGWVGEETIAAFVSGWGWLQPLVAGLVGLIPNCAASVLLTQLYINGALTMGGVIAGLCTGAGVGLAVLVRTNRRAVKQNLFVIGVLYVFGAAFGLLVDLLL